MIGSFKNSTESYMRKCFWTQEKETQVNFNPRLSANRPSNNSALNFFSGFLCNCRNCIHNQGFRSRPDAGRNVRLFDMWCPVVHTWNNCFFKFENRFFHFPSGANGACPLAEPLHLVLPNATKNPAQLQGSFFIWFHFHSSYMIYFMYNHHKNVVLRL